MHASVPRASVNSAPCERTAPRRQVLFFFFGVGWLTSWAGSRAQRVSLLRPGLTSQLSPDPRRLLGLTRHPIPRGTVGRRHVLAVLPVAATRAPAGPFLHFFFVVGLAGPQGPEGVTSSSGLTSQLSPDPRRLLGLTRPPIPRGTVGRRHVLTVSPVAATKAKRPKWVGHHCRGCWAH